MFEARDRALHQLLELLELVESTEVDPAVLHAVLRQAKTEAEGAAIANAGVGWTKEYRTEARRIRDLLKHAVNETLAFYTDGDRLIDNPITRACEAIIASLNSDVLLNPPSHPPTKKSKFQPWLAKARNALEAAGVWQEDYQTELLFAVGLIHHSSRPNLAADSDHNAR